MKLILSTSQGLSKLGRGAYLLALAAVLLLGFVQSAWAQVSVTATAGTPGPTPYPTLKDAFDAINASTHQGDIVISITASTTETVTPCVLNSTGAGTASYTSVLIKPTVAATISGATVTGRGLIELNGADNVTIDGSTTVGGTTRDLTITNTAATTVTYAMAIRVAVAATIVTSANNVTIKNCIVNGNGSGLNTSTNTATTGSATNLSYGIYVGGGASTVAATTAPSAIASTTTTVGTGATFNNLVIQNNAVNACGRGIAVQGSAIGVCNLLTVSDNIVGEAVSGNTTQVYSIGMTLQGFTSALVASNTIYVESFLVANLRGLDLGTISVNATAAIVEKNQIMRVNAQSPSTFGAYGINLASGNGHILRNNCVQGCTGNMTGGSAFTTTFGIFGIRAASGSNHQIYHNSVSLSGLRAGTPNAILLSAAFAIVGTGQTGLDVRNNIFSNTQSGGTTGIAYVSIYLPVSGTSAMNLTLNNNAYYCNSTAGSAGICHVGATYTAIPAGATTYAGLYTAADFAVGATTPTANLRAYTSILNAAGTNDDASYASTNAAPFISATNLHLDLASGELLNIEQKGAVVGVTTDIDGNTRPNIGTLPDIGCDEVVVLPCSAAAGGTITPATQSKCVGQTATMASVGAEIGSGITYQWEVSTTGGGVGFTNVVGGTGATTASYTTAALAAGTYYYRLNVTCSFGPVTGYSNELAITVNPSPTATAGNNSPVCVGSALNLTSTTDIGTTFAWSGPSAYSDATQNPTIAAAALTNAGTYTVTISTAAGCSATASTSVVINDNPVIISTTATPSAFCVGSTSNLAIVQPGVPAYCTASATTGCGASDEYISNVTFGTINNTTACDATTYSDFTAQSTTVTAGATGLVLTYANPNYFAGDLFKVWIDWNQNGLFTDLGEEYTGTGTTLATFSINVPAGALNGSTRMRVRLTYTAGMAPCGVASYGETEDYTVNVTGGVAPYTYLWSDPTAATTTSVLVSPTATTIYTVTVTSTSGCTSTGTTTATVNAAPTTGTTTTNNTTCIVPYTGTVDLTTDGIAYIWSDGATTEDLSAVNGGTYTVTITGANGCTNTTTATVTNAPVAPTASVTPATGIITCTAPSIALTASGGGTYLWDNAAITAARTVTAAGTYIVTVTGTNGCTATASAAITSNNTPPTVSVTPPMGTITCTTPSILLTASGGGNYLWRNGATTSSITATGAGFYSVTVTAANGCTAASSSPISINTTPPVPTITGLATICAGTNLTLTAAGGVSYNWSGPGGFTGTGATITRTGTTAAMSGVYTVTVTGANGCTGSASRTVAVNTCATFTASCVTTANTGLNNGTITVYTSAGTPCAGGTYNYVWTGPTSGSGTGTSPFLMSGLPTGWYSITVTDCAGNSRVLVCYVAAQTRTRTKTEGAAFDGLTAYPNPASDVATIAFTSWTSEPMKVAVYSIDGKQVAVLFDGVTSENSDYQLTLPLSDFSAGIYTVVLSTSSGARETLQLVTVK